MGAGRRGLWYTNHYLRFIGWQKWFEVDKSILVYGIRFYVAEPRDYWREAPNHHCRKTKTISVIYISFLPPNIDRLKLINIHTYIVIFKICTTSQNYNYYRKHIVSFAPLLLTRQREVKIFQCMYVSMYFVIGTAQGNLWLANVCMRHVSLYRYLAS